VPSSLSPQVAQQTLGLPTLGLPSLAYARALPADFSHVLGVVGYGAARPEALPPGCPFIAAPLAPVDGVPAYELWTAETAVRPFAAGPVQGAYSDDLAFGCVRLEEVPGRTLEEVVEQAYLAIFDFLSGSGFAEPIRFWNYLTAILGDDRGMERYRRFNIGRHRAYLARLHQAVPPAASGVGGHEGTSAVYFLAAREAAQPVENPRQVSAYEYPQQYGPRSPSFSRAGIYGEALFISGTASIVGHETRHKGDLPAQTEETLENLRAVINNAGQTAALADSQGWALKIYLHDPLARALVEPALVAMFGMAAQLLYLHGEVCRPDLLIEIEAYYRP
jgi:chorismate lyase/3-hydroxybenzoate synthase